MASPSTLIRSHLAGPVRVTRSISNLLSPTPPSPRRSRPTKTELQTKLAPAHIRAWVRSQRISADDTLRSTPDASPRTRSAPIGLGIQLENAEYPAPFTTTTTSSSPRPVVQLRIMSGGYLPSPIAAFSLPSLTEDLSPPVPSATHSSVQSGLSTFDSQNDEVYVPGAPYGDFRRTPGAPLRRDFRRTPGAPLKCDFRRTPGAPVHYDSPAKTLDAPLSLHRSTPAMPGVPCTGCMPSPEGEAYYRLPSGILTPAEHGLGLGSSAELGLVIHNDIQPDYFSHS